MKKGLLISRNRLVLSAVAVCFLAVFLLTAVDSSVSYAAGMAIEYKSGKLSADVSETPLVQVLKKLSDACGMTTFVDSTIQSKNITVKFKNLPVENGIKRLVNPYSSAVIFSKKTTSKGQEEFYISELKVFDKGNKKVSYVVVNEKGAGRIVKVRSDGQEMTKQAKTAGPVPEERKDTAKMAALNKKISSSVLRSRITGKMAELRRLKEKIRSEEEQKNRQLKQMRSELSSASENETGRIQSQLSMLTSELKNLKKRNADGLKRLQREVDQLRHMLISQEGSLAKSGGSVSAQK
ncbi:MAG: hypothetical protein SRB1_02529 [Desulfobacteraceae bacterium Eth-SRB1]|nr:MAG: hypothetical protein SRB1_02529 [Desulfobacteraceae bacterium Eth-SRB1]